MSRIGIPKDRIGRVSSVQLPESVPRPPLFPLFMTRGARRNARRTTANAAKLLRTTARVTERAAKKAVSDTQKAARSAAKAVAALEPDKTPKAPGRFVDIDGARIHYIARGKGRPVVLIHGNGTMAEDFVICGLVDRLAAHYRVIAIDRPGFGHSTRPRARIWTATAQAKLINGVLERLNVDRPVIVGHSWGTLVALALATGEWRDLRGLVLLSGYYYPTHRTDVALSAPLALPWFGDAARSLMPAPMSRLLASQSFRQVFYPQPVPTKFTRRFPVDIAMGETQLRASAEDASTMNAAASSLQGYYPRLRLPVAILAGSADTIVRASDQSQRLYADIAGSQYKSLVGHGHMTHYSAQTWIGRMVDGLMDPPPKPPSPLGLPSSTKVAPGPRLFRTI